MSDSAAPAEAQLRSEQDYFLQFVRQAIAGPIVGFFRMAAMNGAPEDSVPQPSQLSYFLMGYLNGIYAELIRGTNDEYVNEVFRGVASHSPVCILNITMQVGMSLYGMIDFTEFIGVPIDTIRVASHGFIGSFVAELGDVLAHECTGVKMDDMHTIDNPVLFEARTASDDDEEDEDSEENGEVEEQEGDARESAGPAEPVDT